jgi:hypothetical protein
VLLWSGGGIAFLALVTLVCWLVLGPFFEVRAAIETDRQDPYREDSAAVIVARLGGPRQAARKFAIYLRAPDRWAGEKGRVVRLLGTTGPYAAEATDALAGLLATPDKPGRLAGEYNTEADLRRHAATALGRIGPASLRAAPALEAALSDCDPYARAAAAWALTRIRPEGGLQQLVGLLADPDSNCRREAAYRLGLMGSDAKSALPALEQRLAIENQAPDRSVVRSDSWDSIRILKSAMWKIRSEPDQGVWQNRELRAGLEKTWTFAFAQVPFAQALQRTADAGEFRVVIEPGLAGPDQWGNTPSLTLSMHSAPYYLILEWICKLRGCDWTVKDGAVYVFDDQELK